MPLYYPYYYYGFDFSDPLYAFSMVLLIVAIIVTAVAQAKVKSTFAKFSKSPTVLTGAQAAEKLLASQGVTNVKIERVSGSLTDHFDPRTNVIRLSEEVYDKNTVAAVGVACHEAGHALQYATGYSPIKLRNAIVPVTRIGSALAMPLILLGFLFAPFFATLGVAFYALSTLFQLITLPVEFNASRRAISIIRDYSILYDDSEINGAKKVLGAAAMTYLGALLASLAQLLRLISMVNRRR